MSVPRAFAGAAVVMALIAVAVGLWLAGSPAKERDRQFDLRRENDIQQISSAVDAHFDSRGTLPSSLDELNSAGFGDYTSSLSDPVTKAQYEYRTTSEMTFEVCANFDAESSVTDAYGNPRVPAPMTEPIMAPKGIRLWTHGPGRTCFNLDASTQLGQSACSVTRPCAAGQSCVTLPNREGSYCVPQGKECLAAKCSGQCIVAESYPAQVRCTDAAIAPTPSPKKAAGASTCDLMENKNTGKVDCFGCANGVCKKAPAGWTMYEGDPDSPSKPYACHESESGCQPYVSQ